MAAAERWYFTKEVLANTPSRKCGIDADKELSYRQQAANFIQDMGQRLQVTQLCINTAIVYMHRFYTFHSFTKFHRNAIATCALFLAAKVEEQPRKLEHVIKIAHICLHRDGPPLDTKSDAYLEQAHELVVNENTMLQTLGFDIGIDHPHTYVVKCCQLVRASKDLAQTSYFMATNSLHLTTMCLQYRPTVVACVCIHLACKWSNWEIPCSSEGKEWFWYVDKSVTLELLEELTSEFLAILDKCPSRLKRKIMSGGGKEGQLPEKRSKIDQSTPTAVLNQDKESDSRQDQKLEQWPQRKNISSPVPSTSVKDTTPVKISSPPVMTPSEPLQSLPPPPPPPPPPQPLSASVPAVQHSSPSKRGKPDGPHSISLAVYREKKEKEKERLAAAEQKGRHAMEKRDSQSSRSVPANNQKINLDVKNLKNVHHHSMVHEKDKVRHTKSHSKQPDPAVLHSVDEKHNRYQNISQQHELSLNDKNQLSPRIHSGDKCNQGADIRPPHGNLVSTAEAKQLSSDPFVLLTRLEISQGKHKEQCVSKYIENDYQHFSDVEGSPPSLPSSRVHNPSASENSMKQKTENAVKLCSETEMKPTAQQTLEGLHSNKSSKNRHQRQKLMPSSPHSDIRQDSQPLPHDNVKKISPVWESTKTNGSKSSEILSTDHKLHMDSDNSKMSEKIPVKTSESHNKHERREKHKHRHSTHVSNKEKLTSSHISDHPSNITVSGGLKITIPKDKINLGNVRQDASQRSSSTGGTESPIREALKIKIPKAKFSTSDTAKGIVNANSSNSGLKLVITKDRLNAGSYSTSQKSERELRKRDRSPKDSSHDSRTLDSSPVSKSPKLSKSDLATKRGHTFSQEGSVPDASLLDLNRLSKHSRSHGEGDPQYSSPSTRQLNTGMGYSHTKNPSQASYMPYSGQQLYQQYYPYNPPAHHLAPGGYPNQPMTQYFSHPLPPRDPPLPKEPPPPPPPPPPE